MKNASVILYQFKNFNHNEFLERYLFAISEHSERVFIPTVPPEDLLKLGHITPEEYGDIVTKGEEIKYEHHKSKRGAKNPDIIRCKVQYLQHIIIRRAHSKKNLGAFSLNSQMLKAIVGDEYKVLLSILIQMGFLRLGDGQDGHLIEKYDLYRIGKYSMIYSIPEGYEVEIKTSVDSRIRKFIQKETEQLEHYRQKVYEEFDKKYGYEFRREYEISLNKVFIENIEGFNSYIKQIVNDNPLSIHYYNYVQEGLSAKQKYIQRIDVAGRIYHILTNTDRNIKKYLNIGISADCKNSHPVLFNYFIFQTHGIGIEDAYTISTAMHNIHGHSNIRTSLRPIVPQRSLDMLSNDELNYIYLTSKGQFWDDILCKHPELDRNEVKEKMFAEVFYSNQERTRGWQEFAKEFRNKYPTVMKAVKSWKQAENMTKIEEYMNEHGISAEKPTASLSIAMMNLESRIFTEILRRLYRKRWRAFHIHDCIIVPKTKSKNQPTRAEVLGIMKDVYQEFGLVPTFD